MDDARNFLIFAVHPIYRMTQNKPFKGTVPEMKVKAREILQELGQGWTVKAMTDAQTIYSEEYR